MSGLHVLRSQPLSDEIMSEDEMSEDGDMSEDVFDQNSEDEEDGNYDENEEWPWIKGLNTHETQTVNGKEESVAYCSGRLINPDMIRGDFYVEMEEPSQDLAALAYRLFDRGGCLKEELWKHPIQRGSGVWGKELNQNANFLVFETISVRKALRRQGIGKRMVDKVWYDAMASDPKCKFAFAWACELYDEEDSQQREKLKEVESIHDVQKGRSNIEKFLKAVGFRRVGVSNWVCLAKDPSHPSRQLTADQDYNSPNLQVNAEAIDFQRTLLGLKDDACRQRLVARTQERDPNLDPIWAMRSYDNDTVLHTVFKPIPDKRIVIAQQGDYFGPVPSDRTTKTQSLAWLLSQSFVDPLLSIVNGSGETPLEAYQSYLEEKRVSSTVGLMKVHISDSFSGHSEDEMRCLLKFQH